MPYLYSKTLAYGKKMVFSQDVFNTHGFEYVTTHIKYNFSLSHDFSFGALVLMAPKTYNDLKFCKEAIMIIVVDKRLNSSRISILLTSSCFIPNEITNSFFFIAGAEYCPPQGERGQADPQDRILYAHPLSPLGHGQDSPVEGYFPTR